MKVLFTLFIAVFPVFLIGMYVYRKDNEKESSKLLSKLFILGMLSCIPAAIVELTIEPMFKIHNNLIYLFMYVTIGIAFVEELFKWLIVYKIGYNNIEFDQLYDIIVYCVFVSLGFACIENIFYIFSSDSILTGIFRAVTAIPGHAGDAIVMGDYLGLAKMALSAGKKTQGNKYLLLSILLPTFVHSIYDYCLYTEQFIFIVIFGFFLVFVYIYGIRKIKAISSKNWIISGSKKLL